MALLDYQQEQALFQLHQTLTKNSTDYDYFEQVDIFRQLEAEGYVFLSSSHQNPQEIIVTKTEKGRQYQYNWVQTEFR